MEDCEGGTSRTCERENMEDFKEDTWRKILVLGDGIM